MSVTHRLKIAAASAIALAASWAPATAETMIVSTLHPETHWAVTQGIVPYMECVKEASGGKLDYNLFASGQIASADASIEALNSGLAQIAYIVASRLTSELPLTNLTQLPNMGNTAAAQVRAFRAQLTDGGPIADEIRGQKLMPLMINPFPAYQLSMRSKGKKTLANIAGAKLHVGGGSLTAATEAFGAVPVKLTGSDIYVAMQQGTIDGYQLNPASADTYTLYEVTGSMSRNANVGGTIAFLAINDKKFAALAPELQQNLIDCGTKVEADLAAFADDHNAATLEKFAKAGVDIYDFDETELAALNAKLDASSMNFLKRLDDMGLKASEAFAQYRAALAD